MELINITPLAALAYRKFGPRGRGWDVAVLRGAFVPDAQGVLRLLDGEHTLSLADRYHGADPLRSALRHESDLVWTKPACDLIVAGHAHAPGGAPAAGWDCAVHFGERRHALRATGPRRWRRRWWGWSLDEPEPARQVRLDWALAFGGDPHLGRRKRAQPWADNPVGIGWYRSGCMRADQTYAAPQFEPLAQPYRHFDRGYSAVGLLPLARWWPARARHAGTYGRRWRAQGGQWLADDFDPRFFNGAPAPLQTPHPNPGERLGLVGLWPGPRAAVSIILPLGFPLAEVHRRGSIDFDVSMQLDTVLVDTDIPAVHLSWRLALPQDSGALACVVRWPHWQRATLRARGALALPPSTEQAAPAEPTEPEAPAHG